MTFLLHLVHTRLVLRASHTSFYLILAAAFRGGYYYCPHLIDEKTEALPGQLTSPELLARKGQSWGQAGWSPMLSSCFATARALGPGCHDSKPGTNCPPGNFRGGATLQTLHGTLRPRVEAQKHMRKWGIIECPTEGSPPPSGFWGAGVGSSSAVGVSWWTSPWLPVWAWT